MHPAFTSKHRSVTARQYAVTLWGCGMLLMDAVACAQEAGRKYISVASYVLAGEK